MGNHLETFASSTAGLTSNPALSSIPLGLTFTAARAIPYPVSDIYAAAFGLVNTMVYRFWRCLAPLPLARVGAPTSITASSLGEW